MKYYRMRKGKAIGFTKKYKEEVRTKIVEMYDWLQLEHKDTLVEKYLAMVENQSVDFYNFMLSRTEDERK